MNKRIEELRSELNLYLGDYGEEFENYNDGYISDIASEIADNNIDIYYNKLFAWLPDNYGYVEDAIDEFGTPTDSRGNADLIRMIQQGQYLANIEDLHDNMKDILMNVALNHISDTIDEITEEQEEELLELYDRITDYDELDELFADIDEIFEKEVVANEV